MARWVVVGGADKGGIVVREGVDTASPLLPERLSTGARIEQLQLVEERLQFKRVTGTGPDTGWVSLRLASGKVLVGKVCPSYPSPLASLLESIPIGEALVFSPEPLPADDRGQIFVVGDAVELVGASEATDGSEVNYRRGIIIESLGSDKHSILMWSGELRTLASGDIQRITGPVSFLVEEDDAAAVESSFVAGDIVEVSGLSSEAGKAMNGEKVVVAKYHHDLERVEVRFASQKRVKLKPENLAKVGIGTNDRVEVFGLESEGGRLLNGQCGSVTRFVEEKGRFEVCFAEEKLISLKSENLKKLDGNGVSMDQAKFGAMLNELCAAYRCDAVQNCFCGMGDTPAFHEAFTTALRDAQAPIFARYGYSGGKRGVDRLREDTRRAVMAGDAAVAQTCREMAYLLRSFPRGEGATDSSEISAETRRRIIAQAKPMGWRQLGHLLAVKGMASLKRELLAEGRIVTEADVRQALDKDPNADVDAFVRERLAAALCRRTYHAIFGELIARQPSLLGVEPSEWHSDWAQRVCSTSRVKDLVERGWTVIDSEVDLQLVAGARTELETLRQQERLRESSFVINRGAKFTHLRFGAEEERAHMRLCLPSLFKVSALLCSLPEALGAQDETGLLSRLRVDAATKALVNEPGVQHRVHLDWKGGDNNLRMVSCLLYLNAEDFTEEDGGALRIFRDLTKDGDAASQQRTSPPGESALYEDYMPTGGRLVLFLSRRVWHEALPATRHRYGLTLWVPSAAL